MEVAMKNSSTCMLLALSMTITLACDPASPDDNNGQSASGPQEQRVTDSLGTMMGAATSQLVLGNQRNTAGLNLLARIEVQPNEMVEFYEPAPGSILVRGGGSPSNKPLLSRRAMDALPDAEAVWHRAAELARAHNPALAGKLAMPRALNEAFAHARVARAQQAAATPVAAPPPSAARLNASAVPALVSGALGPVSDTYSHSTWGGSNPGFCTNGYFNDDFPQDWNNCRTDTTNRLCKIGWANGIVSPIASRAHVTYVNVCPTDGNVVLHSNYILDNGSQGDTFYNAFRDNVVWERYERYDSCVLFFCSSRWFVEQSFVEQASGVHFQFVWYTAS
jgi:hypothetical protein